MSWTTFRRLSPAETYSSATRFSAISATEDSRKLESRAGADFLVPGAHRGVAFGDLDNDGRIDAVVTTLNGPVKLFHNVSEHRQSLDPASADRYPQQSHGDRSETPHHDRRRPFAVERGHDRGGLCLLQRLPRALWPWHNRLIQELEIIWPSRTRQVLHNVGADRILTIEEPRS